MKRIKDVIYITDIKEITYGTRFKDIYDLYSWNIDSEYYRFYNLSSPAQDKIVLTKKDFPDAFDFLTFDKVIASRYKTPDGTILCSSHRHDFVSHTDSVTGKSYALDGGTDYTRIVGNIEDLTDCSVYFSNDFETVRQFFTWTTYGKDGKQQAKKILLKYMETDHISAILKTQHQIKFTYVEFLMQEELNYRKS